MGPQADAVQTKTVQRYLGIGKEDGKLLVGGESSKANYFEPALVSVTIPPLYTSRDEECLNLEVRLIPVRRCPRE